MSEVVGEVWVAVRPETAGFAPALARDVSTGASQAGAIAGRDAGQSFSRSFRDTVKTGAAVVGIVGAFEAVRTSVEAAAAHEGEIVLLGKAISNVSAQNEIAGQSVEDLIKKQALERGFIDEELYPSFTRLVGATKDSQKAYRDLGLAEDVARQRHIQVQIAALALAKAEQGSVTSLQRLGIILPLHVRQLEGAAKATAALEYVQQRFAGSAAAFAASGEGEFQRFAEARHLIEESAGSALLPEIEGLATATADWASKSENLERVQRDVADTAHVIEGGVKAGAAAFEIADRALTPLVHTVGGFDKAAELAFGLVTLRKLQTLGAGFVTWSRAVVVGETSAATATTGYTAALTANTVALGTNVIALDAATAGLGLNAAAATRGGVILDGAGASAAGASTKFLSLEASAGGVGSVLKSGVAPAAVLAGYELSTFIRKIPGWNNEMESLGGTAEKLADKLGLIGGGVSKASAQAAQSLDDPAVQQKLADAFQKASKLPGFARDAFIQALVGPGFSFNDARIFATNQTHQAATPHGAATRQNYDPAAAAAAAKAGRPTDLDYQIQIQNALATKTTADETALYQQRVEYLDKRIAALKADNNLTATEKKNLLRLEQERQSTEDAITSIQSQAARAAKTASDQAAQARRQQQQDQIAAAQKTAQDYRESLALEEQKLQFGAKRAELTEKSFADDKAAARKLIDFYTRESHDMKLTEQERLQFASQAIDERLTLRGIGKTSPSSAAAAVKTNVQDFFSEAASEFRQFGSNIATRSGVLSGQDARGAFAAHALSMRNSVDIAASAQSRRDSAALSELQKQTGLLGDIARAVGGIRSKANVPVDVRSADARRVANLVGR